MKKIWKKFLLYVQFSSVTQLCPTLCNLMNCSMPGFPVLHQLWELAQTHVHRVSDAIQPSHILLSPSLLPSIFPSIRIFSSESVLLIRWPKYWSFSFSNSPSSEYSGLISLRIAWLDSLQSKELSEVFSSTTNSSALSFLYSPTLTSLQNQGKTIALLRTFADKSNVVAS